jgi:hypothetical protein
MGGVKISDRFGLGINILLKTNGTVTALPVKKCPAPYEAATLASQLNRCMAPSEAHFE